MDGTDPEGGRGALAVGWGEMGVVEEANVVFLSKSISHWFLTHLRLRRFDVDNDSLCPFEP